MSLPFEMILVSLVEWLRAPQSFYPNIRVDGQETDLGLNICALRGAPTMDKVFDTCYIGGDAIGHGADFPSLNLGAMLTTMLDHGLGIAS